MTNCSEDAEKLRIHALAEAGDIDSLEKMVEFEKAADSSSDIEDTNEEDDTTTTATPWDICSKTNFSTRDFSKGSFIMLFELIRSSTK